MASKTLTFQISDGNGVFYDWQEVIGGSEELYGDQAPQIREQFEALPYEKKVSLFENWKTQFGGELQRAGVQDLSKLENFAQNELGYLAETYGDTDTVGEELSAGLGKTLEGIGDRARFLGSQRVTDAMADPLGMRGLTEWALPSEAKPLVNEQPQGPNMLQQAVMETGDAATRMGESLQYGAKESSGIFQPQNPRWWAEKGIPVVGGLLTDLGLAIGTGPAAPLTFGLSAASQVGGDVLQESRGAYQAQAQKKYDERIKAGATVAEARQQMRGELEEDYKKADSEASIIAGVSTIINSIPGAQFTSAVRRKAAEVIARKGLGETAKKVGVTALSEGIAEVMDEIAQDAGRLGRDIGDLPQRWQQYKDSKPGERYLAAGTLGAVMGGAVDVAVETTAAITQDRLREKVDAMAPPPEAAPEILPEPPVSPETSEPAVDTPAPEEPAVELPEAPEEVAVSEAASVPTEPVVPEPIAAPDSIPAEGETVSYIDSKGNVVQGQLTKKSEKSIWIDGARKEFRPNKFFTGVVQPKPNSRDMRVGDVLFDGDALYKFIGKDKRGNAQFYQGARTQGEIVWDNADILSFDLGWINDPRNTLYDGQAVTEAVDQYNDRENPQPEDRFKPLLDQIGEKTNELSRTVDRGPEGEGVGQAGPEQGTQESQSPGGQGGAGSTGTQGSVQEEVAPVNDTPPAEGDSIRQLRAELTRRARLDRKRKGEAKILPEQIEPLVELVSASAQAIASRTGQSRDSILSRIVFSNAVSKGHSGGYIRASRTLEVIATATPSTIVHEWGHFVLEEHIFNPDESLNILNPSERQVLMDYIKDRMPKTWRGKPSQAMDRARPSEVTHEYFAGMLEKIFQKRYYEGNKPSGMPDRVFAILKKVGDFVRQVYSKLRYQNIAKDLDGSAREAQVLELIDRIFIPDQIEQFIATGSPPTDVLLPSPLPRGDDPSIEVMAANFQAASQSQTRSKVINNLYRSLDQLEADGKLFQGAPEEQQRQDQRQLRKPMQALREFDRIIDDGIDTYATLALESRYEIQSRETTISKARDLLGRMSTGEAIAYFMGDPYRGQGTPNGAVAPDVYVASVVILAQRLRKDITLLPSLVNEGKISANESMEISSLYEKFLKYVWETASPAAGRSVDIFNRLNEPTSTRARVDRLLGILGATDSRLIAQAQQELGGDRFAWIRTYAERYRSGDVTEANYKRREREFKLEFQKAFPPNMQGFARGYINRAAKLFQTLLEEPGAALPEATRQAFGNQYWFTPELWQRLTNIMETMDQLPENSMARDLIHSEITALLASEAGIPLDRMISAHFMAAYLCGPSTAGVSLVGNMMLMAAHMASLVTGYRARPDDIREGRSPVNPNLRYIPQMLQRMVDVYGVGMNRNGIRRGAAWRNIELAMRGFGPGNRFHQGRMSTTETYRQMLRIQQPQGLVQEAWHVMQNFYALLTALPYRAMSVADALVGTGSTALTSSVSAAQVAQWNADRYENELRRQGMPANEAQRLKRGYFNAEYTRLQGYTPTQVAGATQRAIQQAQVIANSPELQGTRTGQSLRVLQWAFFQQEMENMRAEAFVDERNAAPGEEGETPEEILNAYQQEQEFTRALASFSYQPRGVLTSLVNVGEGLVNSLSIPVGRIWEQPVADGEGNIVGYQGGINIGEPRLLRVLLPFLRAASLGTAIGLQMTPWGFLSVARGGPIGAPGTWNASERNTFAAMSVLGTAVMLMALPGALDDDDPLEPDKWHVIGPMPGKYKGKRLREQGVKPYTKYKLNSDGTIESVTLTNVQGLLTSPLLLIGAYNSMKWSLGVTAKEQTLPQALWETAVVMSKMAFTMGPLGNLGRYGRDLNDDTVGMTFSSTANALKNIGIDGVMLYRRAFNEVGAMVNEAGRSVGMDWEPDMKKVPATVQGEDARNAWKTLTNDYLFFNESGRDMLNGYGEPMPEDANVLRKYSSKVAMTPIQKILTQHGLSLEPISRYRTDIRKGSDKEMKEIFGAVLEDRAARLPRHLVGNLTDGELHEYMKDYYRPALETTLKLALKGDPYQNPAVQAEVEKSLSNPQYNDIDNRDKVIQKMALQKYVNGVRSKVEEVSMAKYFADKNPALDSAEVAEYLLDMQSALEAE